MAAHRGEAARRNLHKFKNALMPLSRTSLPPKFKTISGDSSGSEGGEKISRFIYDTFCDL